MANAFSRNPTLIPLAAAGCGALALPAIPPWLLTALVTLGCLALRDAVAAALNAWGDAAVKRAKETPDPKDDAPAEALNAALHAIADRIKAGDIDGGVGALRDLTKKG